MNNEEQLTLSLGLLEVARCPNPNCDNNGTIATQISEDEWEPESCEWCYRKKDLLNQNKR